MVPNQYYFSTALVLDFRRICQQFVSGMLPKRSHSEVESFFLAHGADRAFALPQGSNPDSRVRQIVYLANYFFKVEQLFAEIVV